MKTNHRREYRLKICFYQLTNNRRPYQNPL